MTLNQQIQYVDDRIRRTTTKSANTEFLIAIKKSLEKLKGLKNEKAN